MDANPNMPAVPEDWDRALAIVAHPDDLEYGTSTAVAKWTSQGKTVTEVLATRGEAGIDSMDPDEVRRIRSAEQIEAARIVGVDTVEFLDMPDGMLEYGLPLRSALAAAIRWHRPEVVLSVNFRETFPGGGFNMADHRVLGLAVADAIRDAANRWVFRDLDLEPWQGVRFALFGGSPQATHHVDVGGHLQAGIDSLLAHRVYFSNLGEGFDAAAFLTGMAETGGRAAGVEHAMTFEMIGG
ncbi:PIG-L deacetylase family protein [Spirillospora sp. CA-128828]|uniref:PIG-L deacetylase family protein n=1 Tax=Spirillospora sp. CA-128828 TaxID=3240033 RepID=UPI003D8AC5F0